MGSATVAVVATSSLVQEPVLGDRQKALEDARAGAWSGQKRAVAEDRL